LLCFSVENPASYENVKQKWCPEVNHHCEGTPMILVGTKVDLREEPSIVKKLSERGMKPKSYLDGEELRKQVKAVKYVECSAKTQEGVKQVFDDCIRVVLFSRPVRKKNDAKCMIL
jgi:Ras-related C3 botulinum toxin substrate 1